jgi:hypothetical protein
LAVAVAVAQQLCQALHHLERVEVEVGAALQLELILRQLFLAHNLLLLAALVEHHRLAAR